MKLCKHNRVLVCQVLNKDMNWLASRIAKSQQLSAIYGGEAPPTPTEVSTIIRENEKLKKEDDEQQDSLLATEIMRQDGAVLRDGLRNAGIQEGTLDKLKIFEEFSDNTGRFFVSTLDLTHRLQIYQTIALFEEAEYIRNTYLKDATLDHETRNEWTKRLIEISELVGKTADRSVVGTEAIARLLKQSNDAKGDGKRKPAFKPMKRVERAG